ncbi:hypothetical protein TPHA_0N00170 [Tetrapisispora phaffii CBS 4417]|uniref:Calnexin n=1 Tax=Tetrapisispora phaffii (strain ATCC 24235 / CBS 4417 / NBRC 1672 / NRRL Y-8282 / UCD 70-5) TaxID=1071381 RepID=G8C0X0_TETPH|nr:hypothetical protein TPHA_0N00170 [Tetrapisispora phaffii CBS 4417]CCE65798.1 hypothetical protein TPHA_0N00170 [Tetrapisispora phaffii CBS 4417]
MNIFYSLVCYFKVFLLFFADYTNAERSKFLFEHPELPSNEFQLRNSSFWEPFEGYDGTHKIFGESWISSNYTNKKNNKQNFPSRWTLASAKKLPGFINDTSLTLKDKGEYAMIGHRLDKPIKLDGSNTLVIQYEVKLQDELKCGGAFIKLFPKMMKEDLLNYNLGNIQQKHNQIIFGPDKCIPNFNGLRFGLNRKNPFTEEYELRQLKYPPISKLDNEFKTHLYTLILDSTNQLFEVRIDGKVYTAGNLNDEELFSPGFGSPKFIYDYESEKPEDWDDRILIPDPSAVKPEDWDEEAPYKIIEPDAQKPEEWDESISEYISDPNRSEPSWWNEEVDGEWVAPTIKNPSCYTKSGCGEWKPKMVKNKNYKGKWNQPMIENENYMGEWIPKLVENPWYYEDLTPSIFEEEIGTIVFEFFSGSTNMMFDNVYIGESISEAEQIGNSTFLPKSKLESKEFMLMNQKILDKSRQPLDPNDNYESESSPDNLFDIFFDYIFSRIENGEINFMHIASTIFVIILMALFSQLLNKTTESIEEQEDNTEIINEKENIAIKENPLKIRKK